MQYSQLLYATETWDKVRQCMCPVAHGDFTLPCHKRGGWVKGFSDETIHKISFGPPKVESHSSSFNLYLPKTCHWFVVLFFHY